MIVQEAAAGRPPWTFWLLVTLVGAATLGLAMMGVPALTVVPTLGVLFLYLLFKLPMRIPALGLIFFALVLENPADNGPWRSPLYMAGELLLGQLKKVIPINALVVTGVDSFLLLLICIYAYRRSRRESVDTHPRVVTPQPMVLACLAAIGIVLFAWAFGIARGGEFRWSQWQLMQMLHLPVITLAFSALLPGPSVAQALGRIVVVAACIKACVAIFVSTKFPGSDFMTSHQDSVLFAVAFCHLWLHVTETPNRKSIMVAAALIPLLLVAMIVNDRRLVWVQVAYALAFTFFFSQWSRIKFRLVRLALAAIPVALLYLAIGWNTAGTGIFAPAATIRSMVDSDEDASTRWRDLENFNLQNTLQSSPLTGIGLGHPFIEAVPLPDVTSIYELEPYMPHNSLLGLWAFTGFLGFTTWWMLLVVASFLAMRGYHFARAPPERIGNLTAMCAMIVYMVHCYGDIGLSVWHGVIIVSSYVVVAAKTATANGGYR